MVWMTVGVGVETSGLVVAEISLVGVTEVFSNINGDGDSWIVAVACASPRGGIATGPQACESPISTYTIIQHFRTVAVYHKIHQATFMIKPM